jgi:hypothetical protein
LTGDLGGFRSCRCSRLARYIGALVDVKDVPKWRTRAGAIRGGRWEWVFNVEGRKLVLRTPTSGDEERTLQRLKMLFSAFGVSAETNTDDLVGQREAMFPLPH